MFTLVAQVYTDRRYGSSQTLHYLSSVYCSRRYNNIKYCSKYAYNYYYYNSYSCDYPYCSQNVIGMKCYSKPLYTHSYTNVVHST